MGRVNIVWSTKNLEALAPRHVYKASRLRRQIQHLKESDGHNEEMPIAASESSLCVVTFKIPWNNKLAL